MKKATIIALGMSVIGLAVWAYSRSATEETNSFRFVTVERGDLESVVSTTGTLDAVTTVKVGTQVSGRIAEIHVDFNDRVEKGQVIARIDSTLLEIAVREAQANLERLEAQLRQAERDYKRSSDLFQEQVLAEADFDQTKYALDVARASVKAVRVDLEKAQQDLAYATITAPIAGTIVERGVDVGQTVAASFSAPQLFEIAGDLSRMRILASVDESDIGRIEEGQAVRFTVQAYPEETYTGNVNQVRLASSTEENVVNYTVVVDVGNPGGKLLPGMTATVEFLVESAHDVMKIANAALRFRPTDAMIAAMRERLPAAARRSGERSAEAGTVAQQEDPSAKGTDVATPEKATLLWYLDKGELSTLRVRTGLSDGQSTAIEEIGNGSASLVPGLQVIAATTGSSQTSSSNPFQSQQQGTRSGPPGPGF